MSIQKLADNLYIAPQLTEADVQEAAKLGIQTVICNRPDGEEENQPSAFMASTSLPPKSSSPPATRSRASRTIWVWIRSTT